MAVELTPLPDDMVLRCLLPHSTFNLQCHFPAAQKMSSPPCCCQPTLDSFQSWVITWDCFSTGLQLKPALSLTPRSHRLDMCSLHSDLKVNFIMVILSHVYLYLFHSLLFFINSNPCPFSQKYFPLHFLKPPVKPS